MQNLHVLLQKFADVGLEFVVVGGYASVLHGSAYVTDDLDICAVMSPETVAKLRSATVDLHPVHRMTHKKLSFLTHPPEGQPLANAVAYPDPNVVVGTRLDILPVEIVVRGYLAGTTGTSILTLYRQGQREMYGHVLPDGLADNQVLPAPIITPTSKAADGDHDAPLTPAQVLSQGLLTPAQWETLSAYALALFARGQEMAAARGLILVDTKYEFGVDQAGTIILADEIHTPDSSRYWIAETYEARFAKGERPDSFDKDFVRAWVAARCDPYTDPIPKIPAEMIDETARVYICAFEAITGQVFQAPPTDLPILERVRRNLASFVPA